MSYVSSVRSTWTGVECSLIAAQVDEFDEYENFTNCEMAVLERSEEGRLKLNYCIRNERCVPEQTERARRRSATQRREMRYE